MSELAVIPREDRHTDGVWQHTGRVKVSVKLNSGTLVTLTLPDDWQTLLARVTALESTVAALSIPNSIEDLTYGG